MPAVSVLGTGRMGEPIARRLLRDLGSLTVWNRTAPKTAALRDAGARVAATPAEAAAEITLTVLTDLTDVEALLDGPDGLLAGWAASGVRRPVLVIHGTVSPVAVRRLHERLGREGIGLVDAPLSGGVAGAESGALSVMVGGSAADVERAMPVLRLVGETVVIAGGPGAGEVVKACNQVVVAATVTAISEAMLLADANDIDRAALLRVLAGGLASSEIIAQKGNRWIEHDFEGGGSAVNQLKDLRFVAELGAAARIDLPVADTVRGLFARMVDDDLGQLDHTGVELAIARRSAEEKVGS